MKKMCIFLMWLFTVSVYGGVPYNQKTAKILAQLDSILPLRGQYEQNKLSRIASLKEAAAHRSSDEERFWDYNKLYNEYFAYDSDSAHKYVDLNLAIAHQLGKTDWETEWKIKKGLLLVNTGFLTQAENLSKEIRATLTEDNRIEFYDFMFAMNMRLAQYSDGTPDVQKQYTQQCFSFRDSLLSVMRPDHPDYLRHKGGQVQDQKEREELIGTLEHELAVSSLSTREDAMNAVVLAFLYQRKDDTDGYIQNMARAAIADIRATNSDIDSLDGLSQVLFEVGDLDHAYQYITNCLNIIRTYGNRIHLLRLTAIQDNIFKAYIDRGKKQQHFTQRMLIYLGCMALGLFIAVCLIVRFMFKQRNSRQELNEKNLLLQHNVTELKRAQTELNATHSQLEKANTELKALNTQLKGLNTQLQEANYVKEEYIGYVFSICSNYISKLDEFRKDINRKAKTNMFNEIKEMTDSSTVAQSELKEFYQNFDAIFLNVYPNFVADFNNLLQQDYQFNLKEGEGLNTELRIFALVKLGITDCVKIAEFLHCSAQTVYNYRLRVRNHALMPDKKEFAEAVQAIGKATVI